MDSNILNEIKQNALNDNIPIIMDETLSYLDNFFINTKFNKILEIGTAVRLFCYMFFKISFGKRDN